MDTYGEFVDANEKRLKCLRRSVYLGLGDGLSELRCIRIHGLIL